MPLQHENIEELSFSNVIGDRFGRYSKYIIQDRALPDIRDGLKPVQRRILFAMYQDRNTAENPYRKSAKTVGNVIGNYHPHGDSSVYEAMVRMSQEWKNREPLIDMHGNNGSMDGDPAAAMRYTEARLSKIAMELLSNIHEETVDFALNFDDSLEEPEVLPASFPNLLVNGATGISAGYATDTPPHNLAEVIDALAYMLTHKSYSLEKIMNYIKGPDFPTGAIIQGANQLEEAYKTGRGRVVMRAKTEIEPLKGGKSQIVATELPYDINKTKLIQKLDDIRLSKKIDGIVEIRDESDRNGVRLVIELRREVDPDPILNYLLKNTDLQMNYNFNMVAIHNRTPQQVGLIEMLEAYISHQQEIITRRTQYNLKADQSRLHIVDGLMHMVSILDDVIHTIRQSDSKKDAKNNLVERFEFSLDQAEAIVNLQLYRLTNTDITALQNERLELNEAIQRYQSILNDDTILNKVLVNELKAIKKKYGNPRRTVIEAEIEEIEVKRTLLVAEEQVMVVVTREGYFKRTSMRSYQSSQIDDMEHRELDYPLFIKKMSTYEAIVAFTNMGNYLFIPVNELPEIRWKDMGIHFSQQFKLQENEEIIFVTQASDRLDDVEQSIEDHELVFATQEGMIKRVKLSEFETFRSYKSRSQTAMKLKTDTDQVIAISEIDSLRESLEVILITHQSYSLRYSLADVSQYGPKAQGVIAINLKKDDHVAGMIVSDNEVHYPQAMLLTQHGNLKRFNVNIIPEANRGNRGVLLLKDRKKDPHRVIDLIALNQGTVPIIVKGDTGVDSELMSVDIPLTERLNNGSTVPDLEKLGQVFALNINQLKLFQTNDDSMIE
ncbi:DNA topoisomerase IV subunit A [Aerococcaceae bacterium DSM 111020]|nr:DNA topoisomerase IV subunit A [Aerococcaceae bacterium DSM 111020]